jgi:hypothetical protein
VNTKQEVLISYLQSIFKDYKLKAEYSTNDDDLKVIIVQEQPGNKIVFFGDIDPLFNYYEIQIYGKSIRENKETANQIGSLIGKHIIYEYQNNKYQIIFKQYSNPQAIEYMDIRRVGYTATLQCIINQVA